MRNTIALAIALVLVLPTVSAIADITYDFNVNHVEVEAYDCLDAKCVNVRKFSGSFPQGQTTNNGKLLVRYPSTIASQYGYAMFYFSPGYLPFEAIATWHTFGNGGTATATAPITLSKKALCRAQIDNFEVINDARANVPVEINVAASMDADTHSAFSLVKNNVEFIPPARKAEYYSVDTEVELIVEDPDDVEARQVHTFNGANAIFADNKVKVKFTYVPRKTGAHEATVRAKVVDSQCASQQTQNSKKDFNVFPALPRNECYTLVNNLRVEPGPTTQVFVSKISNYATDFLPNDARYQLNPVLTELEYDIDLADGSDVDRAVLLSANANSRDIATHKEVFNLPPGQHKITINGESKSPLCGKDTPEQVSTTFFVPPAPTFSVTFTVLDNAGNKLNNAEVSLSGRKQTTVNGVTVFTNLAPTNYAYIITHAAGTAQGQIQVTADKFLTVVLQPQTNLLTIKVTDEAGTPLEAEVAIAGTILVTTGGQAQIRLTKGSYTAVASKPGFETASRNVDVVNDQTITIQLKRVPEQTFTLGVTTVNAANKNVVSDVDVNVNGVIKKTVNGRAAFTVKKGQQLVVASKVGFKPNSVTADVQQNKEIILELSPLTVTHQLTIQIQNQNGVFTSASASIAGQTFDITGQRTVTIPEGTHTLVVTKPGFLTQQQTVVLNADKTVTIQLQPVAATTFDLVIVVRDQGAPTTATATIAGQTIQVNGQATIKLPANTYALVVTKTGFLVNQQTIALSANQVVTVDLQKIPASQFNLGVIVIDEPSQALLSGADVVVAGQTKQTVNGRADFQLVQGTHDILVSKAGFQAGTATVSLQANKDVTIQIRPIAPVKHTLTFVVTESAGAPVQGATVSVGGQTQQTTSAGIASFVLTAATYTYTISTGGQFATVTNTINLNQDTILSVTLSKAVLRLTVRTLDQNNQAIDGVSVQVGGTTQLTVGGQTIFNVPRGSTLVQASRPGFSSAQTTLDVQQDTTITLSLTQQATVHTATFLVTNIFTGTPLSGAVIQVSGSTLVTNGAGIATATLPSGQHTFTVTAAGFSNEQASFTLNQNTQINVAMTPLTSSLQKATFTVLDASTRDPVEGVEIGFQGVATLTDRQGKATILNVQNGTFTATARHSAYLAISRIVTVAGDTDVILLLPRNPDVEFDDDSFQIRLENVNVNSISYDGLIPLTVEYKNTGNKEIENVRVVANLLGAFGRAASKPVDLRPNNRVTQRLLVWTDDVEGTYWMRISVGNGKHSRTIHREVTFY